MIRPYRLLVSAVMFRRFLATILQLFWDTPALRAVGILFGLSVVISTWSLFEGSKRP